MSIRLYKGLRAATARLRPTSPITRPSLPLTALRYQSTSAQQPDPKVKAQSILDSLPGNSLASKAAILSAGAGASIAAISNELYVVNEESIVAFCLLCIFVAVGKYGGPLYSSWATSQVQKIRDILNAARADHVTAVKERIDNVAQLGDVVDITKALFEVSKETANLEAKNYELEQKVKFVNEARSVLDSWVRYEAQVKQKQQKELAEQLVNKVKEELRNPQVLQRILQQSVQDVERIIQQAPKA